MAGAGATAAAAVVYGRSVRPRLIRWGATDEEVTGTYPGAELVPDGERSGAMAVTIDAPPNQVWPWLVQMGGDRGGWYSWDHLDNAGRPSARAVHPEWQDLAVGDYVKYWTRRHGPVDAWEVAALEPESIPRTAWIERSARPSPRSAAAAATGLHRRTMGLPAERAARRAHTSGHQRLSSHPPAMARTVGLLLGLSAGCLVHAGTNAGCAQAERRTSDRVTDAVGPASVPAVMPASQSRISFDQLFSFTTSKARCHHAAPASRNSTARRDTRTGPHRSGTGCARPRTYRGAVKRDTGPQYGHIP